MDKSEAGKRGYAKSGHILREQQQQKRRETRAAYAVQPKRCLYCDTMIPYAKRRNTFCNHSCAASYNNRGVLRVQTDNPAECAHCGAIKETRHNKYCDACIAANVYSNKIDDTRLAKYDSTRRRILLEKRPYQCESCGLSEWQDQPIPLELDHIDGDPDHNDESNLRLICPNCHALTDTYKSANRGNGKRQRERRQRYQDGKTY